MDTICDVDFHNVYDEALCSIVDDIPLMTWIISKNKLNHQQYRGLFRSKIGQGSSINILNLIFPQCGVGFNLVDELVYTCDLIENEMFVSQEEAQSENPLFKQYLQWFLEHLPGEDFYPVILETLEMIIDRGTNPYLFRRIYMDFYHPHFDEVHILNYADNKLRAKILQGGYADLLEWLDARLV
jgi:hypothetical protein